MGISLFKNSNMTSVHYSCKSSRAISKRNHFPITPFCLSKSEPRSAQEWLGCEQQCRSFIIWNMNCRFGSVAYPNKLTVSSLEIQTENFAVSYPIGTLKPDILMRTLLTFLFLFCFYAFIWVREKNQSMLNIQEHCIRKLGKIRSELKLLSGIYYWFLVIYQDHLTQLLPFTWDFVAKGQ